MKALLSVLALVSALFLFTSTANAESADPRMMFEAGTRAYINGEWDEALRYWLQVEENGFTNAALFYNIGNAYYKKNRLGYAILYWERAARLTGEVGDVAVNLQTARAKLRDKQPQLVRLPVWKWLDAARAMVGERAMMWVGFGCVFGLFLLLGLRRWVWPSAGKRGVHRAVIYILSAVLAIDALFIILHARDGSLNRAGVIVTPQTTVISAPAEGTGKLLFYLHEGTKVRIVRKLEGWFEIMAGKDEQGWVKAEALEVI